MPAVKEKTYSHKARYTTDQLSLQPRQKKEQRFMPGAYTPKSANIRIATDEAHFDIEYSVKETPGSNVQLIEGVKVVFGKFTKKVLSLSFEYPDLGRLPKQMSEAAKAIRVKQKDVPQDSIKRNYQITTDMLTFMQGYIKEDIESLKDSLNKAALDMPTSI